MTSANLWTRETNPSLATLESKTRPAYRESTIMNMHVCGNLSVIRYKDWGPSAAAAAGDIHGGGGGWVGVKSGGITYTDLLAL